VVIVGDLINARQKRRTTLIGSALKLKSVADRRLHRLNDVSDLRIESSIRLRSHCAYSVNHTAWTIALRLAPMSTVLRLFEVRLHVMSEKCAVLLFLNKSIEN